MSTLFNNTKPLFQNAGFGTMSVDLDYNKKDPEEPSDAGDAVIVCAHVYNKASVDAWANTPPPGIPGGLGGPPPSPETVFKGFIAQAIWSSLTYSGVNNETYSATIPNKGVEHVLLGNEYCFFAHPNASYWFSDMTEDEDYIYIDLNFFVPSFYASHSETGNDGNDTLYERMESWNSGNYGEIAFTLSIP